MEVLFFAFLAFLLGIITGLDTKQDTIDKFEKPVCVEQTVGKDTIKKCYELKEVI